MLAYKIKENKGLLKQNTTFFVTCIINYLQKHTQINQVDIFYLLGQILTFSFKLFGFALLFPLELITPNSNVQM